MRDSGRRRRDLLVLSSLGAVLLATSTGTAAAKPPPSDPLQQQVDAVHHTGAVGVAAEVTSPTTRDVARAGAAEKGTRQQVPLNGRFRIGSATKTFTATVVLQLVGEGRMSLEDTVEHWLPGVVQGNGNDGNRITVRQLLQHTSGIHDTGPDIPALTSADGYRAERFRTYTIEELVRLAMQPSPSVAPHEEPWAYANTNYLLVALITQKVTGRSWVQEVNDRIIRPLGLRDTSAPGSFPFILGPHAHGYAFDGSTDVTVLNSSMAVGSGSIISTAHDLNRFYAALLGGRLLAPAQLDAMTTTVNAPELGIRYGLGLAEIPLSCGGNYFGHRGELLGYITWGGATRDGTRTAVVYVSSDGGQDTEQAMTTLMDQELCRPRS
ncbi:serine hydrolase domain-containing protein [Streptomyces sp. H39-S7]|uniref:serine hydrolase domain-containing protein n=1 Tax=Streptomyces sp. H39-S7 TaxID=3004357 RepID=UPI0022AEB257|nr:serine hydrolase domain-containing protein [Streptomyces sp. H39-S7]MCZ4125549.1 serine hydrolase [Streptomyces sp. H39-S7]